MSKVISSPNLSRLDECVEDILLHCYALRLLDDVTDRDSKWSDLLSDRIDLLSQSVFDLSVLRNSIFSVDSIPNDPGSDPGSDPGLV